MGNGVQKVSERIMAPYRTIVITDQNVLPADAPDGTLLIDPTLSTSIAGNALKVKKAGGSWSSLSPKNVFGLGSITNEMMAVNSVGGSNIKAGAVQTTHIGDAQITNKTLATSAVNTANVVDGAITTLKLSTDLQTTITSKAQIMISSVAPSSPTTNMLWIDTAIPTVYR
jgi:hypothetical protein